MRHALLVLSLAALQVAWPARAVQPPVAPHSVKPTSAHPGVEAHSLVPWRDWSDAVFADAKASKRHVLLNLGAVWCHWCHVMDATTYRDPAVLALIKAHFIPVHVDQDARPELSRRYENFGWPATIVLDADGNDIGKMRGYREPERFASILQAILKDPSPLYTAEDEYRELRFDNAPRLDEPVRAEVERRFRESLDLGIGGLKQHQRYIARGPMEYGLTLAARGDAQAAQWMHLTLTQARALIDPVWGGMYQYSTDSDWQHPHYEKIMEIQANAIRLYAIGAKTFNDPAMLQAALDVRRYIKNFLTSPEGAFFTSQDADRVPGEQGDGYFALNDAARRAQGMPRIDRHVYARENGWVIDALVELYGASGDAAVLDDALKAARWIVANRGNKDGSFRHHAVDKGGPFLGDTLAMGSAMLALYSATGEREWLARARRAAATLPRYAATNGAGYLSSARVGKLAARPNIDENIDTARFANLLHRYSGDASAQKLADVALRYLANEKVALRFGQIPGILQAVEEGAGEPLRITIVGGKADAQALALHKAALAQPATYRRIEWWDPKQGRLVNPDVSYPVLDRPAAFVCTDNTCSAPLFSASAIAEVVAAERPVTAPK